jgi:type I restriction enzyme M protein
MLTEPILKSKIDQLWERLWSGGLSNPLDAIEQLSYLLFMKRLDEAEQEQRRLAAMRGVEHRPIFEDSKMYWSSWTKLKADEALEYVRGIVFPKLREMRGPTGELHFFMENAEFKISKPSLLIEACRAIDELEISNQNQDVQGDVYEYLLSKLTTAGRNGQFRTPRHIIRLMVQLIDPRRGERICDPAAGTCGFLVNAFQHIMEANTSESILEYDEDGVARNLVGDLLTDEDRLFLRNDALTGFDNDSGMTMLRIGAMNLMLHGITEPNINYMDTLSKSYNEARTYDVVLANPPFKGAIDSGDVNPTLPSKVRKTAILFVHLFIRLLEMGGRCAAIVPQGILFGATGAHRELRRQLLEENQIEAVIAMPSGVFKPYAGVSTAVIIFTRGGSTQTVWCYDMEHDGFTLDDRRLPIEENDIPDIISCWNNRADAEFILKRRERVRVLESEIGPLQSRSQSLQKRLGELRFMIATEHVVSDEVYEELDSCVDELYVIRERIRPLAVELNRITRQFPVDASTIRDHHYDLSPGRYRRREEASTYAEAPSVWAHRASKTGEFVATSIAALVKKCKNLRLTSEAEVEYAELGDVAEYINGYAFKPRQWSDRGLPIIRIQNLTGSGEKFNYCEDVIADKYHIRRGDVLISWSASLGVYRWNHGEALLNQHIFKVVTNDELIDNEYFFYAASNAVVEMTSRVHGSTMKHITRDQFLSLRIPLPREKDEQRSIARVLNEATKIKEALAYQKTVGEQLSQALSRGIFGSYEGASTIGVAS